MIGRNDFAAAYDVPRETLAALDTYAALLAEWQQRMNLVGPSTLPHLWSRHFADSAQLLALAGMGRGWLDIGAGAGFPGLVLAILDPDARFTLVESIAKKCRFLEAVTDALGLGARVTIDNRRIETLPRQKFDIVTARALASLDQLFGWALPYAGSGTKWVLPKGARVEAELAIAIERFAFDYSLVPSRTDDAARIVVASGVKRR
ncbi:16S rRNA (guanine(527)-N(7))-methyltransferase RsmG [Polymorphobacter fuscus]|uniref:Ribosomal RNA small subunit methyltransferase G n=1 Tax=Sandarakinorhabdus fusca TaxID=1439888 RepID=A0A7C9KHN0_9SPHN|nr:16S rRNA (guanine(527)-N(7))-methyltransferase RsmG [Polymorphobacter fuscus]KAB7647725.1 16S rRNA (guanine(527)-N(7))-methyltransferase RsmG [Polymorphobacter fuscus]MQT17020.1 16S rRNA (guanine(527)-N(7))-methyltransferase RsmG [Polymorphobacter fuscus]NJC08988.1 16S rRNA (guanine527-N7)-methyltransferase [Polymorphobacter fuscus]